MLGVPNHPSRQLALMLSLEGGCPLPGLIRSQSDFTNSLDPSEYMCMHLYMCMCICVYIHMQAYASISVGIYVMCAVSSSTMYALCLSFFIWKTGHWTRENFEFEAVRPPARDVTGTSHLSQLFLFLCTRKLALGTRKRYTNEQLALSVLCV